jgi:hypothetical protein
MYGRLSIIAAFSLIAALPAHAQLCAGTASYTSGRMQVGGQFLSNDDYSSYGVGLAMGNARGLYGGVNVANNDYDFIDESGMVIGVGGGYQMRPARQGFQICPAASLAIGLGPDNIGGTNTDMSTFQFSAGALIGMVAHRSGNFQLIPTGGLAIVNSKVSLSVPGGGSAEDSETYLAIDLGAGLVFNSVWTIRPMLSLPMGADNREESVSLGVSYNFGRRASTAAKPARQPARRTR